MLPFASSPLRVLPFEVLLSVAEFIGVPPERCKTRFSACVEIHRRIQVSDRERSDLWERVIPWVFDELACEFVPVELSYGELLATTLDWVRAAEAARPAGAALRTGSRGHSTVDALFARRRPEDFNLRILREGGRQVVICISGFTSRNSDAAEDWAGYLQFDPQSTVVALDWESRTTRDVLTDLPTLLGSLPRAAKEWRNEVPVALSESLPSWHGAVGEAREEGLALGELLADRPFGDRPVSLVAFSLGCEVVAQALLHLCLSSPHPTLSSVFLLGGAVRRTGMPWSLMSEAVGGPVVNGYCPDDLVLDWLYRELEGTVAIGSRAVARPPIIDVDVSALFTGLEPHFEYRNGLDEVMRRCHQKLASRGWSPVV
jgi:hypothetical protein